MAIGMCVLALLIYGIITFIVPIAAIGGLIFLALRYFSKDKKVKADAWPVPVPPPNDESLQAAGEAARAQAGAARARAEALMREAETRRKKAELAAALKAQGRLDRLALVYYVTDALKSGLGEAAITAALKAKGWPDSEVAAAFSAYRGL